MRLTDLAPAFFDPVAIRRVRAALAACEPDGPPAVHILHPASGGPGPARVGVFSGSFNPLTVAHTAVVERAHRAFGLDLTAFALSTRTIDKEQITGLLLEDRLLAASLHAQSRAGLGALVVNRGLYVEQAEVVRAALPGLRELYLVVGFDKIVQIFDPRYYADRDAALERLFTLAAFIVAPRGAAGPAELEALLSRPENRPFAERVFPLPVPARYRELSSTRAREEREQRSARVSGLPLASRAALAATGAYRPAYALRGPLLAALAAWRGPLEPDHVVRLMRILHSPAERRRLQDVLIRAGSADGAALRDFLASGR